MSVRETMQKVDSEEFTYWQEYVKHYGPIGPKRGDLQAACVALHVVSALGGKNLNLWEFVLKFQPKSQSQQSSASMRNEFARAGEGFAKAGKKRKKPGRLRPREQ